MPRVVGALQVAAQELGISRAKFLEALKAEGWTGKSEGKTKDELYAEAQEIGITLETRRMLAKTRTWAATILINGRIMTLYLWHLTAMVGLTGNDPQFQPGFEEAGGAEGPGIDFMSNPAGDMNLSAEYFKKAGYASGKYEGDEEIYMVSANADPDSLAWKSRAGATLVIARHDEHRHARPRQVRDLLIARQVWASAHSRRTGTFASTARRPPFVSLNFSVTLPSLTSIDS